MGGSREMELGFFSAFVLKRITRQLLSRSSFIFKKAFDTLGKYRTRSAEYFYFIAEKHTIIQ